MCLIKRANSRVMFDVVTPVQKEPRATVLVLWLLGEELNDLRSPKIGQSSCWWEKLEHVTRY